MSRRMWAVLGLAVGCASTLAIRPASAERFDGDRLIVLDGDTVALPCAVPARGCAEKVRLSGIDTPEVSRPRCEAERISGLKAKERLAGLIRGQAVELARAGETDRYGRTLGTLRVPAGEVGAILMREGLAVAYRPGRKAWEERADHWCRLDRR
ncbi:UNVERIFIED_ORG: endonuclease YncB(thermonuclease family) [Methylobacterium sp. SuP10 SLI 274]|uniref:thermonuclease family protein n=1 Tax=Methylorubrum extorquens TaxID=408 RepID=UPI0020A16CCC|nr:thermonuclease family protein [Methylorubrum extorquens]MDF9861085.1 endonuclease YncB(thermonuclease family) [Methylorubrum pseudosasae]MDH6640083.1 endonuclease YncB(thermonuclease family) [Methylobacterium sp. SuP10 SLI 274]MDH6669159.1 endonuclease YncB(thermonuclease family) [Methylorubrum zatmanii]MCP1556653.1 endonuclease YncB(thermonuclease family) [Methylorubrum extorquens]MDF9789418.1 endonuclease YncB(thermonuclease family) [Methylorubrum extorquens]